MRCDNWPIGNKGCSAVAAWASSWGRGSLRWCDWGITVVDPVWPTISTSRAASRQAREADSHGFSPSRRKKLISSLEPVHLHAQGLIPFTEGGGGVKCQQQGSDNELVQAASLVPCCTLPILRAGRVGPQTDQGEDILRRSDQYNVMSSLTG